MATLGKIIFIIFGIHTENALKLKNYELLGEVELCT